MPKVIVRGGSVTDGPLATGASCRPNLIEAEDLRAPHSRSSTTRQTPSTGLRRPSSAKPQARSPAASTAPAVRSTSEQFLPNTWFVINNGFEEVGYKQSGTSKADTPPTRRPGRAESQDSRP
jgi:hypothetical protein